jgi:rfaE bifunctional protein nucleotidyltransferase chain/domain
VTVATPNEDEAARLCAGLDEAGRAETLCERWRAEAVCVTRGAAGALLARPGLPPLALPAPVAGSGDPCGAGDRFAARLAGSLGRGMSVEDATVDAVAAASAFVGSGGAGAIGAPSPAPSAAAASTGAASDPLAEIERVRARGGTVVATGGCFDLLHAGHVHTLQAARGLGDCLVVCLNSDDSVRRLKGPGRPLVPQADREAVLGALGCVDAVVPFDQDTPRELLERLRPHIFAKGGDYAGTELPEERTLASWGGRTVLLPFVDGRSTTRLIEEAACRA